MADKPNLFDYATSELSQDAFICWLAAWANPEYIATDIKLHQLAVKFLSECFKKHQIDFPESITNIKIEKQKDNIDVLITLNDSYAILIEDKTFSKQHSDQLKRYLDKIQISQKNLIPIPIYYKTGEQGSWEEVKGSGFQIFNRNDLIELFDKVQIDNPIFNDYLDKLLRLGDLFGSYKTEPKDKWCPEAWMGFYIELQNHLGGNWDFVSNPLGGFLGFWWNFKKDQESDIYLQLEENKLCFKIAVAEKSIGDRVKKTWREKFISAGKKLGVKIEKPDRLGSGLTITTAVLKDYRVFDENGLNIRKTISLLKLAEEVVTEAMKKYPSSDLS